MKTRLTKNQQILVEKNHSLIREFLNLHNLDEDYYDIAAIGLCNAVMMFDANESFTDYVFKCMEQELFKATKKKKLRTISIDNYKPRITMDIFEYVNYKILVNHILQILDNEQRNKLLEILNNCNLSDTREIDGISEDIKSTIKKLLKGSLI